MSSRAGSLSVPDRGLGRALADTWVMGARNLIRSARIPEALFFHAVQPVMILLLFGYVFGGAIRVPGVDYIDFLLPGILVQTVAFGAVGTAVGVAEDRQAGLIERYRSLPMADEAVIAGRAGADLARSLVVLVLLTVVGLAIGFRLQTDALGLAAGLGLVGLFAFVLSWGVAAIGLVATTAETAQLKVLPVVFPLVFASSAFVPVESMPGWLQPVAAHQPVTAVVDAARALMIGGPTAPAVGEAVAWLLGLLALFVPLTVRCYRRLS